LKAVFGCDVRRGGVFWQKWGWERVAQLRIVIYHNARRFLYEKNRNLEKIAPPKLAKNVENVNQTIAFRVLGGAFATSKTMF